MRTHHRAFPFVSSSATAPITFRYFSLHRTQGHIAPRCNLNHHEVPDPMMLFRPGFCPTHGCGGHHSSVVGGTLHASHSSARRVESVLDPGMHVRTNVMAATRSPHFEKQSPTTVIITASQRLRRRCAGMQGQLQRVLLVLSSSRETRNALCENDRTISNSCDSCKGEASNPPWYCSTCASLHMPKAIEPDITALAC